MVKKIKTVFFCQSCGHQSPKWLGRCPSCDEWNQFVEEEVGHSGAGSDLPVGFSEPPLPLSAITLDDRERIIIGMAEMDHVLGGGIVKGSSILVGEIRESENPRCSFRYCSPLPKAD